MSERVSRRVFLAGTLLGLAAPSWAASPAVSLRPKERPLGLGLRAGPGAEALIEAARLGGTVAFSVVDVASGRVLEGRESQTGLPPASVTKVVTALYALEALGPDYRFLTRLLATGPVRDGVIDGDLILAGGGDPTLDTDALADMASQLKAAGIRELRGRLRVWDRALPYERVVDPSQPRHVGYNPSVSGLNLNYNRVHFEWKRAGSGYMVTMDARSARYRPAVRIARMSVAARAMPVYTYTDGGDHDAWTVAGGALGNGGARWLPVRKPGAYAAEVFSTFARSHGIVLKQGRPLDRAPGGQVLVTHKSAPLTEILRGMLKYSNNLTAELVGMTATARRVGRPLSLNASARQMSRWARVRLEMPDARLVDHSGLGEASRLSAASLARALAAIHGESGLKTILKDIPLRDAERRILPDHPLKVTGKTGTLYFVSSLAGYMTAPGGGDLAFAIFTANKDLRGEYDRASGRRPAGSLGWNRRSKRLQQQLIERWGTVHGS